MQSRTMSSSYKKIADVQGKAKPPHCYAKCPEDVALIPSTCRAGNSFADTLEAGL